MPISRGLVLIILLWLVGCQSDPLAIQDIQTTLPTQVIIPTQPSTLPTPTSRIFHTVPTNDSSPIPPSATFTLTPIATLISTIPLQPTPSPTSLVPMSVVYDSFVFGQSVFGRPMIAHRFDRGQTMLMLVGGIHGGWESNTVDLMNELIAHFQTTPADVLAGITLLIIPSLNPDGVARGRTLEGRFNDHRVDLNRNWGCDWQETAYFKDMQVNPGSQPHSEPETEALASLILQVRPTTVLFFHSAADGIFAGDCNGDDAESDAMSAVFGQATGYHYGGEFTSYPVTGTAPNWVVAQGIASADVELASWQNSEFERNLRGIIALQCWLLDNPQMTQTTVSVTSQCSQTTG